MIHFIFIVEKSFSPFFFSDDGLIISRFHNGNIDSIILIGKNNLKKIKKKRVVLNYRRYFQEIRLHRNKFN